MHNTNLKHQDSESPKYISSQWVEFAKTQKLISELLQFELDSMSEVIEEKVKNIEEVFYSLASISKGASFDDAQLDKLTNNLDQIVKNLQFQDLVTQKIENISKTLKTIQKYSEDLIKVTNDSELLDTTKISSNSQYIEQVIKERTLDEMRNNMLRNLEVLSKIDFDLISDNMISKKTDRSEVIDQEDDIELF